MAEITQESYDETDEHLEVRIQKGRVVPDYDLNEAQTLARVILYRMGQVLGGDGVSSGIRVVSTGVANELQVAVGSFNAAGYRKAILSPVTITGLVTPVTDRVDTLYARFRETEVDDPNPLVELGVLSRRKVLTVTFAVAQDPTPVPTTTGMPWEGGDYYMALAGINRPTGQAIILDGDITQVYELLPDTSLAQMAVYLDGYVNRLVAGRSSTIETSAATPGTFTIDVRPKSAYGGGTDALAIRYGRDHAEENAHYIGRDSKVVFTAPAGTKHPLTVRDSVGGVDIPWSDDTAAPEQDAGRKLYDGLGRVISAGQPQRSLLRAVNGRAMASIGDGVATFGDFNGEEALVNVVAAALAIPATSLHLYVKQGTYVIPSTLTATGLDLVIEGADQSECVFQNTHATQTGIVTTSRLQIKRITFTRTSTATKAITAGNLFLEDVTVTGMSVNMTGGTGIRTWDRVSLSGTGLLVDLGAEDTKGSLLIRDSRLVSSATGFPLIYSVVAAGPIAEVTLERCFCIVGTGTDSSTESGLVDIQSDFGQTTAGARTLLKFRFLGCTFEGAGVPMCFQVGVHILPYMEFDGCMFTHTGRTLAATHLPVFHPRAVNLLLRNCYFNLQGVCSAFGGGTVGGALDFLAVEKLVVRNVSVKTAYRQMFDDTIVSTGGLSVVYMIAGGSVDVDGMAFQLFGATYTSATLPRQILYVESDSGTNTDTVLLRNIHHEAHSGEGTSEICTQAYIRVAGRFKSRAVISDCSLVFNNAGRLPAGVSAIMLGGSGTDSMSSVGDVTVEDCTIGNLFGNGIEDSGTSADTKIIRNCKVYAVGTWATPYGFGIIARGGNSSVGRTQVHNCNVALAANMGIRIDIPYATVRDCFTQDTNNGGDGLVGIAFTVGTPKVLHCHGNTCLDSTTGMGSIYVGFATGPADRGLTYGFDTRKNGASADIFTLGTCEPLQPMQFNHAVVAIV